MTPRQARAERREAKRREPPKVVFRDILFDDLREFGEEDDGLIILGCAGEFQVWVDGLHKELRGKGLLPPGEHIREFT